MKYSPWLVWILVVFGVACVSKSNSASKQSEPARAKPSEPIKTNLPERPVKHGGGTGLWDLLEQSARRKEVRVRKNRAWQEAFDAELARGKEQVPVALQRKLERWWTHFVRLEDEWLEVRHLWRDEGPLAIEILVENLLISMVRSYELNKGLLYRRARSELYELAEYSTPYLVSGVVAAQGDAVIRRHCIELLGLIGKPALEPLVTAYPQTVEKVKLDIIRSVVEMGELGAPDSTPFLITVVRKETNFKLRIAAIQGLAKNGDVGSIPMLIGCLSDDDVSVRKFSAAALARYRDERMIEPLVVCLARAETGLGEDLGELDVRTNCLRTLRQVTGERYKSSREWRQWLRRR